MKKYPVEYKGVRQGPDWIITPNPKHNCITIRIDLSHMKKEDRENLKVTDLSLSVWVGHWENLLNEAKGKKRTKLRLRTLESLPGRL